MKTPASLLERIRQPSAEAAWAHFVDLYTPLLYHWARGYETRETEAADLVQEVFLLLVRKLPAFHYDEQQGFRAWLRTVASHHWLNLRRKPSLPLAARWTIAGTTPGGAVPRSRGLVVAQDSVPGLLCTGAESYPAGLCPTYLGAWPSRPHLTAGQVTTVAPASPRAGINL